MTARLALAPFIAFSLLGCKAIPETQQNPPDAPQRIANAILAAQVDASGVPGMAAAFVRDGQVLWTGTAGYRDAERGLEVEPDTSFRLASVSKLVTASAAMVLYDRGQLDIDAPVQQYLPGRKLAWAAITARQLAAHTSGIPHYQPVDDERGAVHFSNVDEALDIFAERKLLAPPGTQYNYSSYGYTLLSAAIEGSARTPFLNFVSGAVTYGLDLRPDLVPDPQHDSIAYEFVNGMTRRAGPHDYSYSWGGAGFRGSARDVALFGARVMSPDFLSRRARDVMWTPAYLKDGSPVAEQGDAIGFGWRVNTDSNNERIVHHAGAAIGARSSLVLYPETRDSVSLLSNAIWVSDITETSQMLAAPFRVQPAASVALCPTSAVRYEGTFAGTEISGSARFELAEDICRGSIDVRNAAGEWFNAFPQDDKETLSIIAISPGDGMDRAALITPSGSYELRRQADGSYAATLSPKRRLTIRLKS